VREIVGVRELKREGGKRTRESFQDDNNTTTRAVALLTVDDQKKKERKGTKRTSGEDSRHFPYSASSSFPAASLHTVYNILDTYIYNSIGCDSKESRKWHSHTFVFIFRVAKGAKIKREIDRSCRSSIIQTIASTLTSHF
jgi:hypothetical protein